MKFSLKTMLIVFTVVGCLIGWMGRLWIENPERFFNVLQYLTTGGPFALAVGTIIWVGWRGSKHSRWLIAWGLLLLLTPLAGDGARHLLLPSGQPIRVLSTPRLIGDRLPQRIDEPWPWDELEYRMGQGRLSNEEVDQAVRLLIDHMKTTSPQGWNQPLNWQQRFIGAARQKRLISEEVLVELCEAFYGTRPTLQPITLMWPGPITIRLHMEYGNPWAKTSNVGLVAVWHVSSVSIDGQPVTPRHSRMTFGRNWSAQFNADIEPGDHELAVEVEIALIDESKLTGINVDTATPDQWPTPLKRWTVEVREPLHVEPESEVQE